ncbi:acyl-CoA dehydrogenase [Sphingobium sp. BS19]|nr:acyl-CoA dehydrogenase [Sphingobium sp. BS19]
MDFNLPAENDPRRLEVRRWFQDNPNPSYQQLAEKGYTVPHWPAPWGLSADPETQLIIEDEIKRAGIAHPMSINSIAVNQCGQSLLVYGTEEMRQRFLPPALACRELWTMLFSEPSCGSDLGALRTNARRDGDDYIINGQKIWNSNAHIASIGVVIVRTDPSVPKHRGLTIFLIDMKSPAVEVRPILDMSGHAPEYNEVFLTDVRVPASQRLGEEGQGWQIVVEQLQTERMSMAKPAAVWGHGPTARELVYGLIETGKIKDPLIREEAAKLYAEGELLRLLSARNLSNRINGAPAGLEANLGKMIASPHGQQLSTLAKRTEGVAGMVRDDDELPRPDMDYGMFDTWDYCYWFGPAATLGVGTQEVLKNTISERVLGLPRDLDPTAKIPYSEIGKVPAKAAG